MITPNQGGSHFFLHADVLLQFCTGSFNFAWHQFLQLIHQRTCLYSSCNSLYFVETSFISYFDLFKKRRNSLNAEKTCYTKIIFADMPMSKNDSVIICTFLFCLFVCLCRQQRSAESLVQNRQYYHQYKKSAPQVNSVWTE